MLDINTIRENPQIVKTGLLKRGVDVDLSKLLAMDHHRREIIVEVEGLKSEKNRVSSEISTRIKEKEPADLQIGEMKALSARIKALDAQLASIEKELSDFMDRLPNLPDEDVPPGGKENNEVQHKWGHPPKLDFPIRDHVALAEKLNLVDYERGVKLGGANFWLYKGSGALLEWGLINFFIESHLQDGYEFILPPHILNYDCGYAAGQFPKFADEVFLVSQNETGPGGQFLIPTSETALINLHRDEILQEEELPKKYFAYTPCYRKEVGSYRAAERGTMRGHQFNKVEMFQFTLPEKSDEAQMELLAKAEKLVQSLGLHYQVTKLAAQDMTASMAKTYDVELWIPSLGRYTEVSSVSNAREYQARRGKIRFRRAGTRKTAFVHTLNASGLATSRLFVGLIEQYQQADGSIVIPEVLRKWVGKDRLTPQA